MRSRNGTKRLRRASAADNRLTEILPTHFPERHESFTIVFVRPPFLTPSVESDNYFTSRRLGQQGAAVERSYNIVDISTLTAN
jgi:hypothetical protein